MVGIFFTWKLQKTPHPSSAETPVEPSPDFSGNFGPWKVVEWKVLYKRRPAIHVKHRQTLSPLNHVELIYSTSKMHVLGGRKGKSCNSGRRIAFRRFFVFSFLQWEPVWNSRTCHVAEMIWDIWGAMFDSTWTSPVNCRKKNENAQPAL